MPVWKVMWAQRVRTLAFFVLAVLIIGVLLTAKPAYADTFTVNRTADASDLNLNDTRCDTLPTTGRQCTLRAAIEEANDTNGADEIRFNIVSAADVKTISPTSALPTITEAVSINGYTQTGASANTLAVGNDAVLKIQLNGVNAGNVSGLVIDAPDSTIRGLVINRFEGPGILLSESEATGNIVAGNFIGTNPAGNVDRGNGDEGVLIFVGASNNTIGGTAAAARNIISGNGHSGVAIVGGDATGNEILGNYIGTDVTGTQDLGNTRDGVEISSASNNTVGGTTAAARNVISGNGNLSFGGGGVVISGSSATGNEVLGNFIGTTATGNVALGNIDYGVEIIVSANDNTVGGTAIGARNIISGNEGDGVRIIGGGGLATRRNKVQGNFIGTGANGTTALGNSGGGVAISSGTADNTIGSAIGTTTAGGNRIAHNDGDGVLVAAAAGNSILSNSIHSNGELGIDLAGGTEDSFGVTANDTDDPDSGANRLQNFPVITSATRSSITDNTTITGTLNSNPNQTYTVQCFVAAVSSAVVPDPSGHGEGQVLAGQDTTVQTDADGADSFRCVSPKPKVGQAVTAIATNTSGTDIVTSIGNTSEFSENDVVVSSSI